MRYLIAVLVMGLLAACDLGAATPSAEPLPSLASADATMDDRASDGHADPTADASSDGMSAACADAWAEVDTTGIESLADLEMAAAEVEVTIEACESLQAWADEAQQALPEIHGMDLEAWLFARCATDERFAGTAVCEEMNAG